MIDWNSGEILSGSSSATNQSAVLLLDFMADNLLSQYILEPTRLNNCLDLCLSNAPNLVTHVSVTDTPLSDHKLLEIFLSHDPCRPDPSVLPNFSVSSFRSLDFYKADYDRINHLLDYVNWNKLWQLCDPEEFPELLNIVLLQICEIGCTRKQASVRRRGSSVSNLSRKKRKLKLRLQQAEQNPVATATHLQSLRNQTSSVHADMGDVINQDLNSRKQQAVDKVHSNPMYFYRYAKKFSKQKRSIPMLFNRDKRTCVTYTCEYVSCILIYLYMYIFVVMCKYLYVYFIMYVPYMQMYICVYIVYIICIYVVRAVYVCGYNALMCTYMCQYIICVYECLHVYAVYINI